MTDTTAPVSSGSDAAPVSSSSALDSAFDTAFSAAPAASAPAGTDAVTSDTDAQDAASAGDRARDPHGRFAPKDGAATDTQADTAATDGATATQNAADQTQTDPAKVPTVEAPASMSAVEREAFNAATPELQGFLARREKDARAAITKAQQESAESRKRIEAIEPAVPTLEGYAKHFGIQPVQLVQQWASVQEGLFRDPKGTLQALAQRFRVDLNPQQPDTQADAYVDPQVAKLNEELAGMRQQLAAVTGQVQTRAQAEQHAALQQTAQTIESFRAETAADGTPKYPHFDAVRADMALLFESGRAQDLAAAYDMATRLNPDVWGRIQAEQQAKAAADAEARRRADADKAEQERKRQLAEAQKVGRVNQRGTGAPGARPAAASLDDAVNQAVASMR